MLPHKPGPGNIFMIKIDGISHRTQIDNDGVQRFPENRFVRFLLDDRLNEIWKLFRLGLGSGEEMRQIYRMIGYSVSGYVDIFPDDVIENPLWEKEE